MIYKIYVAKRTKKEPHHLWQEEGLLLIMQNAAFIEITVTVIITITKIDDIRDVDKHVNM